MCLKNEDHQQWSLKGNVFYSRVACGICCCRWLSPRQMGQLGFNCSSMIIHCTYAKKDINIFELHGSWHQLMTWQSRGDFFFPNFQNWLHVFCRASPSQDIFTALPSALFWLGRFGIRDVIWTRLCFVPWYIVYNVSLYVPVKTNNYLIT